MCSTQTKTNFEYYHMAIADDDNGRTTLNTSIL